MRTRIVFALRHKIMAAFALFLAGGLVFTVITYQRHTVIQERLQVIEDADDLINGALEVRRYEKNFFLYGGRENYRLMLEYLTDVERRLGELKLGGPEMDEPEQPERLAELLAAYRRAVIGYGGAVRGEEIGVISPKAESLAERIRGLGREFTESLQALVRNERQYVNRLVTQQKNSLFVSVILFFLLTVAVAYYLVFLIILPLSRIERAAEEIIHGRVQEIPRFAGSTEIQSLISALNMMIKDLDKKSEQLIQREKMAALGTLTSGVAHELNNPLSNISSSTQILLEELETTDIDFQGRLLGGIEQQVEKARDIVKSLLEFAREREFEPLPTDALTLVEKTVKLIKGDVPGNVEVEVDIPEGLEIEVDQRRMSQALMNLMLNGMQAMEDEGGVLKVMASGDGRRNEVSITVEDEGMGIPVESQGKIFDPFFSTKDVGEGTGLGLYVTYGIVQKHGGRIEVESRVGEGTRFIMTLPARQLRDAR